MAENHSTRLFAMLCQGEGVVTGVSLNLFLTVAECGQAFPIRGKIAVSFKRDHLVLIPFWKT